MRVKLTFSPVSQKSIALPINYNYFLTSLIYKIIRNSSQDYSQFLHDEGYKLGESKKGFKLFTYSMLVCESIRISGEKIHFLKGPVDWYISSPITDFIQHLVSGVFIEGQEVAVGPENMQIRLLIQRVETLLQPEFKSGMRFTCLSPITASKDNGPGGTKGSTCYYIRPWDEGFSEAVKTNLMKKYKLVNGKEIPDPELQISIDSGYMKKRNGKITKNINFKGTNIIGFLAPFEITGTPELIEVGYETGFGEKGSMGFGMVKEAV